VAFARTLVKDVHTAEDIVADCYCRLLAKAGVYDLPKDGTRLLMKSIVNAAINANTRKRSWTGFATDSEETEQEPEDRTVLSVSSRMEAAELQAAIGQALATLPPTQRAAIELKSLDYSNGDIADMLDTSVTHVGVLIHRARVALEKALAPYLTPGETP
jgi:RNA polymerase sigma-70 factor (ECF subfamily)